MAPNGRNWGQSGCCGVPDGSKSGPEPELLGTADGVGQPVPERAQLGTSVGQSGAFPYAAWDAVRIFPVGGGD